jgi:splicing factor 3B subunit 4
MSGAGARHWENDKESTCYIGNLDERITDALVWELCIQAGPVVSVHLPKDRVTQTVQGYGFVEFRSEQDAEYACNILNGIRMHGKPIRVNKSNADKRGGENGGPGGTQGSGAELFVGNLDQMADEKVLYDTFSRFGLFASAPKVARDDKFASKGYGFISYVDFEGADAAIEHMHGQYLMNKEVTVQFAYKKDGKGERHGDAAERAIAASAKKHGMGVAPAVLPANLIAPTPSAPPVQAPYGNGFPPAGGYNNNYGRPPPMQNQGPPQGGYGGYPAYAPPPVAYQQQMPPPAAGGYANGAAPARQFNQTPLQAPPTAAGLPPRPPPSMGGYGGPQQPPFPGAPGGPPPGLPPGMPPGYGHPPMGSAPNHGR